LASRWNSLSLALPDQHKAEAGKRGAISRPLDLPDHEARGWPPDHARALADPQEADGQREQANDEQHVSHGVSSRDAVFGLLVFTDGGRAASRGTLDAKKPRTMPGLFNSISARISIDQISISQPVD